MNIIDSPGWLEYFSDGPNAHHFLEPLRNIGSLMVPVITIYEVFKVILRESTENDAFQAVAAMQKGKVADLNAHIAMTASKLSLQHNLPMADSIILATAQVYKCVIWTQKADFENIEHVQYFSKLR